MTTTLPPASEQTGFLSTSRGKLVLFLLAAAGFLDFVDASTESVNLHETPGRGFYRVVTSVCWGGLMQEVARMSGGSAGG